MEVNELPKYDMSDNPTGCCPRFTPDTWDNQDLHFKDKLFVKAKTRSVMHVPINMGAVFGKTFKAIESADAQDNEQFIVLSRDPSPWTGEHFFSVTKEAPGAEMVRLSGDYHTKVFEGPYRDAKKWRDELISSADGEKDELPTTFFFYTTCPKCAKYYGKNYVVGLVERRHSQAEDRAN